jgi:hypothetical protein
MSLRIAIAVTVLGLVGCGDDVSPDAVPVRVMTYNVGNPDTDHPDYPLRLKEQAYEDYMGEQIRAFAPDIVVLQEVLATTFCDDIGETDSAFTCFDSDNRAPPVRRILGDDYTIVCDSREHVECIGVHVDFGAIVGFEPGAYDIDGADTPPLPLESCIYSAGECSDLYCDAESTMSAVTVETGFADLKVVHAHPNAAGENANGVYTGAPCRELQLQQGFEGLAGFGDEALAGDGPALIAGDFNMDPVRLASDGEMALWSRNVGDGNRFTDFTPLDENGAQHATRRMGLGLAIDHVLGDRATGECIVYGDDRIGTDPGTLELDYEFDWSGFPDGQFYVGRIDHFAIVCDLVMDLSL